MSALFQSLTGFELLEPAWLLLALLLPVPLWIRHRRGNPAVLFAPAHLLGGDGGPDAVEPLPGSWRTGLRPLPRVLQTLGLVLVVVALARPAQRQPVVTPIRGIDVLLCLDVSSSMTTRDMDARRSRLAVAKDAAARFVNGRPDDRIGLISFARYPDVVCPPTLDHRALKELIQGVEPVASDGPEDATGIGTAVARAAQVLSAVVSPSKVVILLTDGEENVATAAAPNEIAPLHAGQLCEQLGVRAYTIAAGTGGRGPAGAVVALDTSQVERLSERTGGRFFVARDAAAMERVFEAVDQLEQGRIARPRTRVEERFLGFVVAALVLLLGGRVIESTALRVLP